MGMLCSLPYFLLTNHFLHYLAFELKTSLINIVIIFKYITMLGYLSGSVVKDLPVVQET